MKFSFHPEAESEFIAAQTFYATANSASARSLWMRSKLPLGASSVIQTHGRVFRIAHVDAFATAFHIRTFIASPKVQLRSTPSHSKAGNPGIGKIA